MESESRKWAQLKHPNSAAVLGILVAVLSATNSSAQIPAERKVIIYVWDGLRPDSVSQVDTPNLYALREEGVNFTDNHSTYPTFTMMNAASFATGSFGGTTGYYGNSLWQPTARGSASSVCHAGGGQWSILIARPSLRLNPSPVYWSPPLWRSGLSCTHRS
jgi:Type I phosphodiesterase / nucleotide pyrophosphatase